MYGDTSANKRKRKKQRKRRQRRSHHVQVRGQTTMASTMSSSVSQSHIRRRARSEFRSASQGGLIPTYLKGPLFSSTSSMRRTIPVERIVELEWQAPTMSTSTDKRTVSVIGLNP